MIIYPNPTNEFININILNNQFFTESIDIYNMIGQLMIRKVINTNNAQINISTLPNGLYFIQFQNQRYKSQLIIKN